MKGGGIIIETACLGCGMPMWAVDPDSKPVCDQCQMEREQDEKYFEERS